MWTVIVYLLVVLCGMVSISSLWSYIFEDDRALKKAYFERGMVTLVILLILLLYGFFRS